MGGDLTLPGRSGSPHAGGAVSARPAGGTTRRIRIPAGRYRELWTGSCPSNYLYFLIRGSDGIDQVRMWWSLSGFNDVVDLGCREGSGVVAMPVRVDKWKISPSLVAFADQDTVVYIDGFSRIDGALGFDWS
jgi:hypothetical protein